VIDKKYDRSALSEEQSQRIADKINATMQQEQLHLDSSLSLHKLAQHVAISPNYISQTLNETMGTNFFDFVNKWRIETAKPKIIANEDTVLNIAMEVGFNARSSFYKVFKKEIGKTPTEYRKSHLARQA
jgi:YesN/AraC family two-component response regulator